MNVENTGTLEIRKKRYLALAMLASSVLIVAVFLFTAVPMAIAETKSSATSAVSANDDSRRYAMILQNVFDFIREYYVEEVDSQTLYEGAMKGMFAALEDPHSTFLAESDMSDLNDTTQGNFGGLGINILKQVVPANSNRPAYIEVASPIEDTPGWRAGIQPGDLIIAIEGESTGDMSMDTVLSKLRGIPGTEVSITMRRGEKLEFPLTIKRAIIEVPTVKSALIGDIGYVRITTFTPNTVERTKEAIKSFGNKRYKGLIVDLRNNYGGLLQSAIAVSDLFIDEGAIVSTKSRIEKDNVEFRAKKTIFVPKDLPVVVMINRASASASEIVAGALKDSGRAYLVGEKSFGKGSVQQVYPIGNSGFKLTTARYYTPSGINIDKIGIPPDLEVLFPTYSDEENEAYAKLMESERLRHFVRDNPKASPAQQTQEVRALSKEYALDELLVARLLRDEYNRTSFAPIYDLEYDIQLQAVMKIFKDGNWTELIKKVKSLKELQELHLLDSKENNETSAAKDLSQ